MSKNTLRGSKRTSQIEKTVHKRKKVADSTIYFEKCLKDCGLTVKEAPEKFILTTQPDVFVRNLKKTLLKHLDYPRNVNEFVKELKTKCTDREDFKHYLFPNIVRDNGDTSAPCSENSGLMKLLCTVQPLQNPLLDYIFEHAVDFALEESNCHWIQMILRTLTLPDNVTAGEKLATGLIDLLDVAVDRSVRLEIISSIPDIIGDQNQEQVARELSRFLREDHELIPAILDCLTYLDLQNTQYREIQEKAMGILRTTAPFNFFPNFVKFLLAAGRTNQDEYLELWRGLRDALDWTVVGNQNVSDLESSQVLTAMAIQTCVAASKLIAAAWLKFISTCKVSNDYKPIDVPILLIIYSSGSGRDKIVENLLKKQIKNYILKVDILNTVFTKYKAILKLFIHEMLSLTNTLLKTKNEPAVVTFASHWYVLMFTQLEDCRTSTIAELMNQGLTGNIDMMDMLNILSEVASKDIGLLKPNSLQMLALLEKLDDLNVSEIREVMSLLCGLAYNIENSILKDDIHMVIRKRLGSSVLRDKFKGVIAAVQAVKYLMQLVDEECDAESTEISYSSISHLAEGPTKEAAQFIDLLARSTYKFSNLMCFFYDELSSVILVAEKINKRFLIWINEAVTNDLQNNFIVDGYVQTINNLKITLQFCLNSEQEAHSLIAINVAGLAINPPKDHAIDICMLPSLFHLVRVVHSKLDDGDISSIDTLLGCGIMMPVIDGDNPTDDLEEEQLFAVLDCFIHCVNWFREVINGFADQEVGTVRRKIIHRLDHMQKMESLIYRLIVQCKGSYKIPVTSFFYPNDNEGNKANEKVASLKKQVSKTLIPKSKAIADESAIPETGKTQPNTSQAVSVGSQSKISNKVNFRNIDLNISVLLNEDLQEDNDNDGLSVESLTFILKCIQAEIGKALLPGKKKTPFSKKCDEHVIYNHKKAQHCAKEVYEMLPRLIFFLDKICKKQKEAIDENDGCIDAPSLWSKENLEYQACFENLLNVLSIFFKWSGFKDRVSPLLKNSLKVVSNNMEKQSCSLMSISHLFLLNAKYFEKCKEYCIQISSAVALINLINALLILSENETILQISKEMATEFLACSWQSEAGGIERGLIFNQYVDIFVLSYFTKPEILSVKALAFEIAEQIPLLKGKNDVLSKFMCISKSNLPILYRGLITAVYDAAKLEIDKGLSDNEHLELWKNVAIIMKTLTDIAKKSGNRNNLSTFLKKSFSVLKLYLMQGLPMLEMKLKNEIDLVVEIMRLFQQTTRFLHSLCCHSRLKNDTALISKVPQIRSLLETLVYKVKATLAVNNCTEAFWMGSLKNKNIQGEIIASQESNESGEVNEDCDDQLPEDDRSGDESDEDMLNPGSKSVSDII